VLDGEDVAKEVGDPLLALDGEFEIAERVADVGLVEVGSESNSLGLVFGSTSPSFS